MERKCSTKALEPVAKPVTEPADKPWVRRPWGPIVLLMVLGWTVCTASTFAADGSEAVDPFYERLFQDGILALSTGDAAAAAQQLKLGCFGMLDAPKRLADCLTRLASAQAELEDREGFLDTLARVLEVERRFNGYSEAKIPTRFRRNFETRVEQWAPPASLVGLAAFADIADRQNAIRLRQLPLDERRAQLDILIAQSPAKKLWRLMEIDIELESENYPRAAELVEQLGSQGQDLRCAGGRAQVGLGSCDDSTLTNLEQCSGAEARLAAVSLLSCHIERADRESGEDVVASMDESQKSETRIRRMIRKLRRIEPAAAVETEPAASNEASEPEIDDSTSPVAAVSAQPNQQELASLERSRAILNADRRHQFEATYATVTDLAQRFGSWAQAQHLAAELAYRLSRWQDSVTYFERAEATEPLAPDQQFYLAIALFKSDRQAAAEARLEQCLPSIQPSDFVHFWSARIRNGS